MNRPIVCRAPIVISRIAEAVAISAHGMRAGEASGFIVGSFGAILLRRSI